MRSQNARLPPPGAGIAQTRALPSPSINLANTLNSEPRNASVTSAIRSGLRKSGLSDPKARIAVRYGMRGNGSGVTAQSVNSVNSPCITGSTAANTSSWVANAISRSSW